MRGVVVAKSLVLALLGLYLLVWLDLPRSTCRRVTLRTIVAPDRGRYERTETNSASAPPIARAACSVHRLLYCRCHHRPWVPHRSPHSSHEHSTRGAR